MNKIEQVARGIVEADRNAEGLTFKELSLHLARAAIEAMRVPTDGMRDRYNDPDIVGYGPDGSDHDKVWEAGIDAALEGK